MKYYITDNTAPAVPLSEIPEASYAEFYADLAAKLADARYHIAHYFALPLGDRSGSSACCSTTRRPRC